MRRWACGAECGRRWCSVSERFRETPDRRATPILGMGTPRPASEATEDRNRIQKNPLFLGLLK